MRSELGVILSVILLAILSIVFGVMAYMNYSAIDPGDDPKKKLDTQIAAKQTAINTLKATVADYQNQKEKLLEDIGKQQQWVEYYTLERAAYVAAHEQRQKLIESGNTFQKQATEMGGKIQGAKKAVSDRIQASITRERTTMEQAVEKANADKAKIQAEILAKKEEYDKSAKKHVQDMNYVKSQLGNAKSTLADLTTREEIAAKIGSRADGHVVLADFVHNLVSIDVGTGSGVKNGMRFEVYAMLPGAKHVTKAYIEVRKAGPTQSECLVIQRPVLLPADELTNYTAEGPEYVYNPYSPAGKKAGTTEPMTGGRVVMSGQKSTDPIVEGDYIQNPFFEYGRQLTFYIAGSKEMAGERQKSAIRYSASTIRDVAERHGAKVVDAVSTDVNYIIAQKNPQDDPEFKKAVDLGIPVIYEWELFRFLDNN